MRNYLQILNVVIIFFSCDSTKNDTPENFAKSIFQIIQKNDLEYQSPLYIHISDTGKINHLEFKKDIIKGMLKHEDFEEVKQFYIDNLSETIQMGENMGIVWDKARFDRVTFKKTINERYDLETFEDFYVYFTSNNREYRFGIENALVTNIGIKNFSLHKLIDVEDEIERLNKTPFLPGGFKVNTHRYFYDQKNVYVIEKFYIEFINKTFFEFDSIKFRLKIVKPNSPRGITKFERTFDIQKKIYPGDISRIDIPDLQNFYYGEDLRNSQNVFVQWEIIDLFPHPTLPR